MTNPEARLSKEEFNNLPLTDLESALSDLESELGRLQMYNASDEEIASVQDLIDKLTSRIDEITGMKG